MSIRSSELKEERAVKLHATHFAADLLADSSPRFLVSACWETRTDQNWPDCRWTVVSTFL